MKSFFSLLVLTICFCLSHTAHAQWLSRERVVNLENFDKQTLSWGYYIGFNNYDFNFKFNDLDSDIYVKQNIGFNLGLIGDLRLNEYLNLRLEPGFFSMRRDLEFDSDKVPNHNENSVKSAYIHIPLLLKASTKRINNFKPFILGGFSYSHNLGSKEKNPDDNSRGVFRMKTNSLNYELGIGVDLYLYFFKFSPSIRGIFGLSDEMVYDDDSNSPWTGPVDKMKTRGVFVNFTFQ